MSEPRDERSDLRVVVDWVLANATPGSPEWLAAARVNNALVAPGVRLLLAARVAEEGQS